MPHNSLPDFPTETRTSQFREKLKRWFRRRGRSLPWRETSDPYRIWVSELMLQQTTVKAVIPYFTRFIERFPTVRHVAQATEQEVLKYWEGLGYYSRGRNLHRAAVRIVEGHDGEFPKHLADLERLPGIGRYTAGAIRSFAFNLPAPIVEANTLRVYSRLLGYRGDAHSPSGKKLLWEFAESIQPPRSAAQFNHALMDLGALVCTPTAPDCRHCPVRDVCRAAALGIQADVPAKKRRPVTTRLVEATIATRDHDRYLVCQRGSEERWAGMWDFPRFSVGEVEFTHDLNQTRLRQVARKLSDQLAQEYGIRALDLSLATEYRHTVTRYRIRLLCFTAIADDSALTQNRSGLAWHRIDELETLPFPVTGRKFARFLSGRLPAD